MHRMTFPTGKFVGAIGALAVGLISMMVYVVLRGMSHSFGSRADDPWMWTGIVLHLIAGWLFLGVAAEASGIPATQRSRFVRPGIIVSYVLAALIVLFNAWAVATLLELL